MAFATTTLRSPVLVVPTNPQLCQVNLSLSPPPGYHQQCHEPTIPDETLEPDEPWQCIFCEKDVVCPYIVTQEEAMNALEVAPDKKNTMPTTAGRSVIDLKVTPAKRTSEDKSSNSSLIDNDVAPSRKERSAPSNDNPKEVRGPNNGVLVCVWSLEHTYALTLNPGCWSCSLLSSTYLCILCRNHLRKRGSWQSSMRLCLHPVTVSCT